MNFFTSFWNRICVPLDGFLWQRDISHHILRPALRNQILATGAFILAGAVFYAIFPWLFWFGAGLACITWIFWSWAKFFLKVDLGEYGSAFLRAILVRFFIRLLIIALLLFLALSCFNANPIALVAGMIAGSLLGLLSYAWQLGHIRRSK